MAFSIISYPDTYKRLAEEIMRVLSMYQSGEIPETAAVDAMSTWRASVPALLLDTDGVSLNPSLSRLIGKRRANVVIAMLAARKK